MNFVILRIFFVLQVLLAMSNVALGCDSPIVHPERAAFTALLESLPVQPPGPVQLKFRVDGEQQIGKQLTIRIAFWQKDQVKGRFWVTPSSGLELVGPLSAGEIPHRGSIDLKVRAIEKGYHHLKIETRVDVAGVETLRTELLGVPIALDEKPTSGIAQDSQLGFTGPRIRNVLKENANKAMSSLTE